MLDLLTHEEVLEDETAEDDEGACLYCDCRPAVAFCGRYQDGPIPEVEWDDDEICPDCLLVLDTVGCPGCGCRDRQWCGLCDTRPWWRRWLS